MLLVETSANAVVYKIMNEAASVEIYYECTYISNNTNITDTCNSTTQQQPLVRNLIIMYIDLIIKMTQLHAFTHSQQVSSHIYCKILMLG